MWSECFDRLFSYQAMKSKFEKKHFRLNDSKQYAGITSTDVVKLYKHHTLLAFDQILVYWGLWVGKNERKPGCYSLDANGFEDADFEKKVFIHEWLKDPGPREFDRIDSIPPSRSGNAAPSGVTTKSSEWSLYSAANLTQSHPQHVVLFALFGLPPTACVSLCTFRPSPCTSFSKRITPTEVQLV